ncbi:prevent-host-death protein [Bradyrhizobium sp. 179]|uniref:prevent-host-death protein n=1 Tax=Bradyrhizobium sp. 179 TaxID=2782648 RepID=UPI001FFBBE58|nr:prevent-host-death protein [Bradyrhizobium sp. 179]MCK1545690.1 prevent-host-death protein [Bradyrhizobium sp. 179]
MASHPKQPISPPTVDEAGSAARRPAADRDRSVVRTVDLTDEDIAAIEAAEMTPGFEHLNAELKPKPASLVEEGVRFTRDLGQRREKTDALPADQAFRDSLYDDS